jgi:hypothetical protein
LSDTPASSSHIPWHPAFFQAIQLELEQYRDVLEFQSDYRLTSEPLEIDVVIIKKAPEVTIQKNIARIFKRINLLEYKSPEDYFSLYDFYKVLGYVCLYAALNKTVLEEMTLSIVETRHPRELFKYFEERKGHRVRETSAGIYVVSGYPVSIQIIESKRLSLSENLWLTGLNNDLNSAAASIILKESRKKGKGAGLDAYIYAFLSANVKTLLEVVRMANGELTLEDVLEKAGLVAKWEKRGEARGEKRGEARGWEKAVELVKQGYTAEQLERMSPGGSL